MAKDAIRVVLEDRTARGEPIPDGEPPRIREVTLTLAAWTAVFRRSPLGKSSKHFSAPGSS